MGEGDMELLAMIGAFLGPYGIWITLLVGSWTGLCMGLIFRRLSKQENPTIIPFGPALAAGAVTYLLWSHQIFSFLYGN
jgi:leader peptidase (prepilin peptidase)/N-methyltransferase